MALRDDLIRDEGLRLKPYRCTAGKLSIGCGRNLDDVGITQDEALYLLDNDIARVRADVKRSFTWFDGLNEARQNVVLNMVFNLGLTAFSQFYQTIAYIKAGDYAKASEQMLKSLWAKQVKGRAERLARQMRDGHE